MCIRLGGVSRTSTLTNAVRPGRMRGRRGLTLMHGGEGSVLAVHFVKGVQAIAPRLGDERAWWPPGRLTQLRPSETWLGGGGQAALGRSKFIFLGTSVGLLMQGRHPEEGPKTSRGEGGEMA
jgi:hypothetical protein